MKTRNARNVSEREIAIALLIRLAEYDQCGFRGFSFSEFTEKDVCFIDGLARRIGIANDEAYRNKLRRVTRKLVRDNVLRSEMRTTTKEKKQMNYMFPNSWTASRMVRKETDDATSSQEREAKYLLSRVYPEPGRD
jgi:hypothetical protein